MALAYKWRKLRRSALRTRRLSASSCHTWRRSCDPDENEPISRCSRTDQRTQEVGRMEFNLRICLRRGISNTSNQREPPFSSSLNAERLKYPSLSLLLFLFWRHIPFSIQFTPMNGKEGEELHEAVQAGDAERLRRTLIANRKNGIDTIVVRDS